MTRNSPARPAQRAPGVFIDPEGPDLEGNRLRCGSRLTRFFGRLGPEPHADRPPGLPGVASRSGASVRQPELQPVGGMETIEVERG